MTGYKIGMAEEAVIADLTAKLAECKAQKEAALRIAEQHSDVVNNMIQQLTESQAREAKLQEEIALLNKTLVIQDKTWKECERIKADNWLSYIERLAESQAREVKLREALNRIANDDNVTCQESRQDDRCMWVADRAISIPSDDTALKEYRKKVLLKAADWFDKDAGVYGMDSMWSLSGEKLRRMAEE